MSIYRGNKLDDVIDEEFMRLDDSVLRKEKYMGNDIGVNPVYHMALNNGWILVEGSITDKRTDENYKYVIMNERNAEILPLTLNIESKIIEEVKLLGFNKYGVWFYISSTMTGRPLRIVSVPPYPDYKLGRQYIYNIDTKDIKDTCSLHDIYIVGKDVYYILNNAIYRNTTKLIESDADINRLQAYEHRIVYYSEGVKGWYLYNEITKENVILASKNPNIQIKYVNVKKEWIATTLSPKEYKNYKEGWGFRELEPIKEGNFTFGRLHVYKGLDKIKEENILFFDGNKLYAFQDNKLIYINADGWEQELEIDNVDHAKEILVSNKYIYINRNGEELVQINNGFMEENRMFGEDNGNILTNKIEFETY